MVADCVVPPSPGEYGQRSLGIPDRPAEAASAGSPGLRLSPARMWQMLVHEHRPPSYRMTDIRNPHPDGSYVPMAHKINIRQHPF